jgi:putative RNA 2'-phosphotransferase
MNELSKYLCFLLRHHPEKARLDMDIHGWVSVEQLTRNVNEYSSYQLNRDVLERLVADDNKGRYRFDLAHEKVKCCQGHSIPWVIPELTYCEPPRYLYHGTTTEALSKIEKSGRILKMSRHAVHMQASPEKAWLSAERWNLIPVLLKIDASAMSADGYSFGITENNVWCTEYVPINYVVEKIMR